MSIFFNRYLHQNLQNTNINYITKFNCINAYNIVNIIKIVINVNFRSINFDKSKILIFFLILEFLIGRGACATTSRKPILALGIRKGAVVGCKLTLRKNDLYYFIDTLILGLPRFDNFNGFLYKKNEKTNFSFILKELYNFHAIEFQYNLYVQALNITFVLNTYLKEQKIFKLTSSNLLIK